MRVSGLWAVVALAAVALFGSAGAHRQHVGLTTVTLTEDGRVRVIHSLHAHDIEPELAGPDGRPVVIGDIRSRAQAALYVSDGFSLHVDGKAVALETLGAERDGQHLYVYQEGAVSDAAMPEEIEVSARVLFEVYDDQRNRVNVEWPGGLVATADLRPETPSARVSRPNSS